MNNWRFWLAALVVGLSSPMWSQNLLACTFCYRERPPVLNQQFGLAEVVLFVRWQGIRQDANGDTVTDFSIDQVIKHDPRLKVTRTITVRRDIPKSESNFLFFCEIYKG